MKAIVGIVAVVLLLAVVGWISFSSSDGTATIKINTEKAKHDIGVLEKEGEKLLGEAEAELQKTSPPASN